MDATFFDTCQNAPGYQVLWDICAVGSRDVLAIGLAFEGGMLVFYQLNTS